MEENKNIEQQLTNALDNSNNKQAENIIEKNPVETSKILPENSPLQNEAEEVIDGDKRTDRVDNEVIKDSIKDYNTPGGFLNQDQSGMLNPLRVYKPISSYKEDTGEKDEKGKPIYKDTYNRHDRNGYEDYIKKGAKYYDPRTSGRVRIWGYPTPKDVVYDTLIDPDPLDLDMDFLGYGKDTPLPKKLGDNKETYEFLMNSPLMQKYMNYFDDAVDADYMKSQEGIEDKEGYVQRFIDFAKSIFPGLEEQTESHPEAVQESLPNTPIAEEAKQITDDSDARNDEVNNQAVEETVDKLSEDFDTVDDLYNYLIDWDKVNVYKPEENHSEWENEPDFDTSDWTAEMGENPLPGGERPNFHRNDAAIDRMQERMDRDEDFAGPDELPATYEQIVEPGKELALTSGNEITPVDEPIEVDYRIIDEEVDNDDSIPEEEKEAEKQRRYKIALGDETPEIIGGNVGTTTSAPGKGTEIKEERRSPGSSFGNSFKTSMPSGSYNAPSVKGDKPEKKEVKDIKSKAGGGTLPPTNEGGAISVNARNANSSNGSVTSNGFTSSGATNKTGSSLSVKPAKLPNGEVHTQDYGDGIANGGIEKLSGLAKAHIDNIETRIRELPEGVAEAWGFGIKYKHIEYNGTQLDQCTPNQLNEIEKILSRLGV